MRCGLADLVGLRRPARVLAELAVDLAGRELRTVQHDLKLHHGCVDLVGRRLSCGTHGVVHRGGIEIARERRTDHAQRHHRAKHPSRHVARPSSSLRETAESFAAGTP
ncbi:hypothetical protein BJS_08933 [Bradyrhizobium japonicum SEMIA 5079]|nr:hypothetical protein BJS_08933 [Bradyrhizobium japonicum SEMIA 5079]